MRVPLSQQLHELLSKPGHRQDIVRRYRSRIAKDRLTRDEHPSSHVCVYFAAFDPVRKEVFIGHHKKANLWLFSGGHIDQGETIEGAVSREIWEEWGQRIPVENIPAPSLLTITDVVTPNIGCKIHFDIWHFFPVEKEKFEIDQSKILEEFHEIRWRPVDKISRLISDPATISSLQLIAQNLKW